MSARHSLDLVYEKGVVICEGQACFSLCELFSSYIMGRGWLSS